MAFDKSAIAAVIQQSARELAVKAVAEAKTAKLLMDNKAVTPGVKGHARINKMNTSVNLVSGAGCGTRTALGDVVLTEKVINVVPMKDLQNVCVDALYDTYYASMIAQGQNPETESLDASFIKSIMDYRALKIASVNETMLWQGDTAISGVSNLKYIDGLLKQIAADGTHIAITPVGTAITAQLQSIYKAMPVPVRKSADFRLFVGEDTYDSYLIELDAANKFREATAFMLTGTTAMIEVVPGLTGTGKVVAAMISDFHLGIDGMSDADKAILKYSDETEQWYADFHYALGIALVNGDQVGLATLA